MPRSGSCASRRRPRRARPAGRDRRSRMPSPPSCPAAPRCSTRCRTPSSSALWLSAAWRPSRFEPRRRGANGAARAGRRRRRGAGGGRATLPDRAGASGRAARLRLPRQVERGRRAAGRSMACGAVGRASPAWPATWPLVLVLGAAIGAAFGSEAVFSLLPGDQALLDTPRPGFSVAVRLDAFDAEFGTDGRPRRLDTSVSSSRRRVPGRRSLQVNAPGDFDGYLVHPWTYGPAARLRVTTLGGIACSTRPSRSTAERDGCPLARRELPSVGLDPRPGAHDAASNELGVSVARRLGAGRRCEAAAR